MAKVAFKLPTTAKQMTGEMIYEREINFAIDIFSSSSAPETYFVLARIRVISDLKTTHIGQSS